jgi:hypothetical protein
LYDNLMFFKYLPRTLISNYAKQKSSMLPGYECGKGLLCSMVVMQFRRYSIDLPQ